MKPKVEPNKPATQGAPGRIQLMVSATADMPGSGPAMTIERGMAVLDRDGRLAGRVAGVVFDSAREAHTHLLVLRWQSAIEYRVLTIGHVARAGAHGLQLDIDCPALDCLPEWSTFESQLRNPGGNT